jgi:hypothetical protein
MSILVVMRAHVLIVDLSRRSCCHDGGVITTVTMEYGVAQATTHLRSPCCIHENPTPPPQHRPKDSPPPTSLTRPSSSLRPPTHQPSQPSPHRRRRRVTIGKAEFAAHPLRAAHHRKQRGSHLVLSSGPSARARATIEEAPWPTNRGAQLQVLSVPASAKVPDSPKKRQPPPPPPDT